MEKIDKIFADLKEQIGQYGELRQEYDVRAIQASEQKQSIGPAPREPDFEKFAKEHGMEAGHTGLVPDWELKGTEIGQSTIRGGVYLWQYAFQSLAKFRCEVSNLNGDKGSFYLFWKTADEKERVPKFEDKGVRAEVLRAWKLIHAQDIALKAAETLAAEARKADKPLKQVFADRPELHVILPSKFTWLNFPNVAQGWQQPARLSAVEGVDVPGWDFMREVFGLERGQVGVAFNAPKTVAYVVRPTQFTPSYDVLRAQFETEPYGMYAAAGQEDRMAIYRAWLDEVKKSTGFAWGPGHKAEGMADYVPPSEE